MLQVCCVPVQLITDCLGGLHFFFLVINKYMIKKLYGILLLPDSSWNRFSLKCYRNNFCPNTARMTVDMENLMNFGSQVMTQQVTYVVYMLDNCIFSVVSNFYYFGKNLLCIFIILTDEKRW